MMIRSIAVVIGALALSGCAGISAGVVTDDSKELGYRYYAPAPFLFVRSDGKGGLTSEVVYLPDTTQTLSLRPYATLASNNATLSFNNGMLTEASAVVDETVVPTAFIDALSKAASAAIAADLPSSPVAQAPPPYLFRIIVRSGSIQLKGGPAFATDGKKPATINVSINTPPSTGGK